MPFHTHKEKLEIIAHHFGEIIKTLGLDLDDPSLKKSPHRVAKMYLEEVFTGLNPSNYPKIIPFDIDNDDHPHDYSHGMIQTTCEFCTFCEHHFTPTLGKATVSFIPKKKTIGLSRIIELVKYFSQRPQLQERMTVQIAESLKKILDTEDVSVTLTAQHFCMIARDDACRHSEVTTQHLSGRFKHPAA